MKGFYSARTEGWNSNPTAQAISTEGVFMTLEAHWNATAKLSEPDILRVNMTVELPSEYATALAADTVTQYFTMKKMGGFGKSEYTTVLCDTNPVNATHVTQTVAQFTSASIIGEFMSMWSGSAAPVSPATWQLSTGKQNMGYKDSVYFPSYKSISCEAMLLVDKEDRDETFFGDYEFFMGAEFDSVASGTVWLAVSE